MVPGMEAPKYMVAGFSSADDEESCNGECAKAVAISAVMV